MSTDTDGVPPSVAPGSTDDAGAAETVESGAAWLQAEIQRRMAVARGGSGGRHARHGGPESAQARPDYRARHASDPAPAAAADPDDPDAATEPAAPGVAGSAGARPAPPRRTPWSAGAASAAAAWNASAGTGRATARSQGAGTDPAAVSPTGAGAEAAGGAAHGDAGTGSGVAADDRARGVAVGFGRRGRAERGCRSGHPGVERRRRWS